LNESTGVCGLAVLAKEGRTVLAFDIEEDTRGAPENIIVDTMRV
jgi:hypothetical protein